jgi:hypothetical protein
MVSSQKERNANILRGRFVRGRSVRGSWAVKRTAVPKILKRHALSDTCTWRVRSQLMV